MSTVNRDVFDIQPVKRTSSEEWPPAKRKPARLFTLRGCIFINLNASNLFEPFRITNTTVYVVYKVQSISYTLYVSFHDYEGEYKCNQGNKAASPTTAHTHAIVTIKKKLYNVHKTIALKLKLAL